jgi:hypothetical protein
MKKSVAFFISALFLLGAGCKLSFPPATYEWNAYDRVAATTTIVSFEYPSSFGVKKDGNLGEDAQIRVGNLTGRVEIYNINFFGDENIYKDYPDKPKETFKKGNFYVYVFYDRKDTDEKSTLNKIVESIKIK